MDVQIEESWKKRLNDEFRSEYFHNLKEFLVSEKLNGRKIYPPGSQIFSAFNHTAFENVKVVILGQDPYHGEGQAHGLSFSVPPGVRIPPSLLNMFKEIRSDLGYNIPTTGNLEKWATQGVLLLNATLTVRANEASSHQNRGWETFTDSVIRTLSESREHLVFMLWGRFAQAKENLIDASRHLILKAAHPSPFSADRGFFGCRHFSRCNEYLRTQGKTEINWKLD
ncbi:MAG: uracil-DNA glycosylase [Bacteroidetes bacterium]|nr:MAG: uracil-DNA glycosylase [Bacteroidota bacterium]REK06684.1 MAG: uracil-DNA glycosylase [Bacteroidota bacterium]REK33449.1 MAG: uracil-DNA glycosylase [Bacteroidota bacterium]REK49841.1 MAG: uracil-DNA glycosylase [Bacteroidota bacterium]